MIDLDIYLFSNMFGGWTEWQSTRLSFWSYPNLVANFGWLDFVSMVDLMEVIVLDTTDIKMDIYNLNPYP